MTSRRLKKPRILVVDVGGTYVKCAVTGRARARRFRSGPQMAPGEMVANVLKLARDWPFDAVSIGYPGVVRDGEITREPWNLGPGWIGFDFAAAFGRPVRIANDAAMQALGCYEGGKMLFLGLGTGLGSALVVDGVAVPMELGHLHCGKGRTYEDLVGERARDRIGNRKWRSRVADVVQSFTKALLPDYIVIGGGNARRLKELPALARLGDNTYAFIGGFRLWEGKVGDAAR
jgi:glucokinase